MIFIVRFVTVIMEMVWVLLHDSVLILEILLTHHSRELYLESAAPCTDGQIFNAISNGSASGIMLGLKDRLSPEELGNRSFIYVSSTDYVGKATLSSEGQGS